MNKVWLICQREFLNRVQKKSFLIATILIPMIFPAIIALMGYIFLKQEEGANRSVVHVLDESGRIKLEDTDRYKFVPVTGAPEHAKSSFRESDAFALLFIPEFELSDPKGIMLYTKENVSIRREEELEGMIEARIHDLKLEQFNIDKATLAKLKTEVSLNSFNLNEEGGKQSNTRLLYGLGFALGILIYVFVLVYGMQIMLGVIEEKTSKIVEVIVSSVRPFQLMLGKILGIAAVGLTQFAIWIVLISVLSSATLSMFGLQSEQQAIEQVAKINTTGTEQIATQNPFVQAVDSFYELPILYIVFNFAFYFLGGYLLYGALFAAVGAAVDSQQEAQQFNLPIMLPLIIGYFALFMFILPDPHSTASFWFSVIPFTSPVAMVGRLAFRPPVWELVLSQVLLIGGFIFTTWVAARIYRVGILMHGSKVNYRVLAKWFMMKG